MLSGRFAAKQNKYRGTCNQVSMENSDCVWWILIYCLFVEQTQGKYVLINKIDHYDISEPKCLDLGLQVAKLETDEAFYQAAELITTEYSGFIPIWIGLQYDPADETFRWRDGSVTSRNNWYTGGSYNEPDNMPTERCVAIHKTWDNYTSMVTRECDAKKYNILCGTYELPVIRSELFYDSTKSEVVSGTELFSLPFKSKVACARVCVDTESCTHYFITAGRTRCALFSGNTSPGITGSGYLYTRIQ